MGYDTYLMGSIKVRPTSLTPSLEAFNEREDLPYRCFTINAYGEEATLAIIDGEVTVVEGEPVVVIEVESGEPLRISPQDLTHELGQIMEAILLQAPSTADLTFEGAIYAQGEDHYDTWRVRVDPAGRVIDEAATLVWPNGEVEIQDKRPAGPTQAKLALALANHLKTSPK